jgi:DNA polymerase-3 subunit alpha (Gram-positive type)
MRFDKVVCIDLETTGFSKSKDQILEFAAVAHFPKTDAQRFFNCLVDCKDIPQHITALTGISEQTLKDEGATPIKEALAAFEAFVNEDGERILLVGHNIKAFDLPFLGWQVKTFIWDTLEVERERKHKPNALADVCKRYGITQTQQHRALDDAKAAFEVFLKQYAKDRKMLKFC